MAKRRPKDIGTADETAVVKALRRLGYPNAERRALRGGNDCGDITGVAGVMWEVKGGHAGREASDRQVEKWFIEQVAPQIVNANADVGVLVLPRKGVGPENAEKWWGVITAYTVQALMGRSNQDHEIGSLLLVRAHLEDVVWMLRHGGYG